LGRERSYVPLLIARGAAAQARLALAQSNLQAAISWAERCGLRSDDDLSFLREAEYLTLARVLIAQGRSETTRTALNDALGLLDRLLASAEAAGRMSSVIEILVLRALALEARSDTAGALTGLERALALAAPEGYVRIFVDEGAPMAALLRDAHARSITPHYVAKLLAAFPSSEGRGLRTESAESIHSVLSPQSSTLVEPLSQRELEILRLIAAGQSNQEIAASLVVALSTIKKHINNLFGKLEVASRTQAIARAHELNLL
jgi:LuxR family transcriptional regulator, maltose regulon positive regulatory protein